MTNLTFLIGEFLLCDFALVFLRVFSVAFVIVVLAVFFPCDVFVGECDVPMIVVVVAIVRKGSERRRYKNYVNTVHTVLLDCTIRIANMWIEL